MARVEVYETGGHRELHVIVFDPYKRVSCKPVFNIRGGPNLLLELESPEAASTLRCKVFRAIEETGLEKIPGLRPTIIDGGQYNSPRFNSQGFYEAYLCHGKPLGENPNADKILEAVKKSLQT